MTPSTHEDYLSHLSSQLMIHADNPVFWTPFCTYGAELATCLEISLDPVREALAALYCPTNNGAPKDPCAMLRSWLLMTYSRVGSPTAWADRLKKTRHWPSWLAFRQTTRPVPPRILIF
jgi:hypothetical protein